MSTTKRAEAMFQALREFRTEFESIPSPPRPDTGRTAVVRRPSCAACSFEPQAWLHNELLRADTRERIEGVALKIRDLDWARYRKELKQPDLKPRVLSVETLVQHQRECMRVEFAGNFPSGVEYVFVPGGRVQVAKLRKLIDTAPRAEETTVKLDKPSRSTITTRVWGHYEYLLGLMRKQEGRSSLLTNGQLQSDGTTKAICAAMIWLINELDSSSSIERLRVNAVPDEEI